MSLSVDIRRAVGDFALDVAFEAPAGVTAVLGRSGAGKSTLVSAVSGLVRPDDGRITLDGDVLFDARARMNLSAPKRRIGVVFQDSRLFPHFSVRSNLLFGRRRRGATAPDFDLVVETLGIGHLLARRPRSLSGGERQRVAIAALLTQDPPLLLLDEPVAHLDLHHQVTVLRHLVRLAHLRRKAVLLSIHDLNLAARFATHALVIGAHGLLRQGPAESTMDDIVLSSAFGHAVVSERIGKRLVFVAD